MHRAEASRTAVHMVEVQVVINGVTVSVDGRPHHPCLFGPAHIKATGKAKHRRRRLVGVDGIDAGVEFFISKPINIIEVKSVIRNVDEQIKNEKTLTNIKKMFMAEIADMPKEKKKDDGYGRKVLYILNRLGMSGEKGGDDILRICEYLHNNGRPISQVSIGQLCELLSDAPKNMEQRVRRAIAVGMSNLAHLGIEDFMNETFTAYSSTLFPFEEIRAEMDHIRGKRRYGGKVSIKKFIDSLMLAVDREV